MVSQSQGTQSINAEWLGFNIFSPINLHVTQEDTYLQEVS